MSKSLANCFGSIEKSFWTASEHIRNDPPILPDSARELHFSPDNGVPDNGVSRNHFMLDLWKLG